MTRAQHLTLPGGPLSLQSATTISSQTGFPRVDFNSDGTITYTSNGVSGLYFSPCGWYRAANFGLPVTGIGSQYEIRLTPSVGTFGLELSNTWVTLASGTSWNRGTGNGTSVGLIEIRAAATSVVLGSTTLTLNDLV